jgi:hypothetical protein
MNPEKDEHCSVCFKKVGKSVLIPIVRAVEIGHTPFHQASPHNLFIIAENPASRPGTVSESRDYKSLHESRMIEPEIRVTALATRWCW